MNVVIFLFNFILLNSQQPLLQYSVSRDPSKIILICWFGDFFLSIYLENRCAAKYSNFQDSLKHKFSAISNVFIQNLNLNECMN